MNATYALLAGIAFVAPSLIWANDALASAAGFFLGLFFVWRGTRE